MKRSCIYFANIMHHRLRPRIHRFRYKVYSWLVDLDELDALDQELPLFSRNKRNFLSFYDHDYGDGSDLDLKQQVTRQLLANGMESPTRIALLCFPRVFGYVFNPLSIYFCYREDGSLLAVLHEVSNTFGERHTYIIPCNKQYQAGDIIRQSVNKAMHVSPFMAMDYRYGFRLKLPEKSLMVAINMVDSEGIAFSAVLSGRRMDLSHKTVLRQLINMPFMTFKVTAAILWQAARLYCKGLKVYRHKPRSESVSSSLGISR